jgi:hypothetical protein
MLLVMQNRVLLHCDTDYVRVLCTKFFCCAHRGPPGCEFLESIYSVVCMNKCGGVSQNFSVPCPRTKHLVDSPKQLVCKIFQTSARLFKIFANVLLIDGKCRNIPDFHFCQTFYFFKASGRFFKTSKNLANKLITSARHRRRSRF